MSTAPEPVDDAVLDPPGDVALGRDRVEVAREQHERAVAAPCRAGEHARVAAVAHRNAGRGEQLQDVRGERRLAPRLGRHVDQLERPRGEPGCKGIGHARGR